MIEVTELSDYVVRTFSIKSVCALENYCCIILELLLQGTMTDSIFLEIGDFQQYVVVPS